MSKVELLSLETLPNQPVAFIKSLGRTVVIAPHPDDESLGCGGLMATLRAMLVPVAAVLITDGTMSHPHSRKFPPAARRALREAEFAEALSLLGVEADASLLLGLPDGAVTDLPPAAFEQAVASLTKYLEDWAPATIVVPWRRDPHPDHRATSKLVQAAVARLPIAPRVLEYLVWAWERAAPDDLPRSDEVTGWRLDISTVLAQKQQAIAAHRSQIDGIIDDDPTGFQLAPQMLAHFARPYEVYVEALPSLQ
ncbi:PIG-L deacetylase family protein [Hymenobacter sp. GOD-10R]|uniref:PIG-L deacetylase family protein n=1 Tax=Hymenobacter sp. GOD-10R TaxID=3093922 RepID=UPI002D779C66|nr:PIG-L deacetylase family protein [Hymenobacter sp. GOD-10R]WRQ30757.1 PIG-L deacetylase family protein [Hymenobacter sp. GOD-10R]